MNNWATPEMNLEKTTAMYKAEIFNLKQNLSRQDIQHIDIKKERTLIYGSEENRIYIPSDTARLFHSDSTFIRLVMGPYGSGKTTLCLHELVRRACSMPRWAAGDRRRSRVLVIRNTAGELYSTTLQSWLAWFGELGSIRKRQKPLLTYEHTFNDGHGIVELEAIFLALDRPDDVRKLKSFETTYAYLNEMSELPQAILEHMIGRLNGRYPSKSFCPEPYWSGIIADTNPPDEDHYIYKLFEENKSSDYKIFKQPSGLVEETVEENGKIITRYKRNANGDYIQNPFCDNYANLNDDYYVKLATKRPEGFVNVYCGGKYGIVESGKRVFTEYNDDVHSVPNIKAIDNIPIDLGFDFGLTPACIVTQMSPRGQLLVLKEYLAEDMGIRTFAKNIVLPGLARDFPNHKIGVSEADPSGAAGSQIMEELSCIGELNEVGIKTNPASTNNLDVRLGAVRYFLSGMDMGVPNFLLSREGCPIARKSLVNGYHYKRVNVSGENRYKDEPNKNHPYSDIMDALQYVAMKFAGDRVREKLYAKPAIDTFYNPGMGVF